jgi:hypothetical protein
MTLNLLDNCTALNLDAVASIRFAENGEATVQFRAVGANGFGFLTETFSGEAACNLRKLIGVRQIEKGRESGASPFDISPVEFSRNKAWYSFLAPDGRRYFMAYVNAKEGCSMRTFDAEDGRFINLKYKRGKYQEEFADFIQGAQELSVTTQPNLARDCKERLPEAVLAYLKKQVESPTRGS